MTKHRNLATDRRAATGLLTIVGLSAVIGMSALAVDMGAAYSQKARLQTVADSAALAGAITWTKNPSASAVQATVNDVVIANGWPASVVQTATAPTAAVPKVTVSLVAPSALTLSRVLTAKTSINTSGYAVASVATTAGSVGVAACLMSLTTLMVNGSINVSACAVVADSLSTNAITLNSGASLTANLIVTPGKLVSNGTVSGTVQTGAALVSDIYATTQLLVATAASACLIFTNYSNQTTLKPGCWSNVNIGSAVTLSPGTYVFSNLNVNSGGSITGTGVTMIAQQAISPNGNITITAPTTGIFAGLAIYAMAGMNVNANVIYTINGLLYSPFQTLILNGGTFNLSACTYIIAQAIIFNSNASFTIPQSSCSLYGFNVPTVAGGGSKTTVALTQ